MQEHTQKWKIKEEGMKKERDDAFEYGGFSFARESLNLIDNLERSKSSLMNDENLKDSNALKKIVEHLDIIQKDMLGILKKIILNLLNQLTKN